MTNINTELFKRYQPKKKLEIINNLTESELLNTTEETVSRIVKEVGYKWGKSLKRLTFRSDFRTGNKWNSEVEDLYICKRKLYIGFYLQYDNTDTSDDDLFSNFIRRGEYCGTYQYKDRYGNPQTTYYRYYEEDKARVIRRLLYQYLYTKYANKLKNSEN